MTDVYKCYSYKYKWRFYECIVKLTDTTCLKILNHTTGGFKHKTKYSSLFIKMNGKWQSNFTMARQNGVTKRPNPVSLFVHTENTKTEVDTFLAATPPLTFFTSGLPSTSSLAGWDLEAAAERHTYVNIMCLLNS